MAAETGLPFHNDRLPPAELPDFARVHLEPVAAGFPSWAMLASSLRWGVATLGVVAAALIPAEPPFGPGAALLPALLGVATVAYRGAEARRRGWAAREHDLIYRSGLWWQQTVVMPYSRIQHVETGSGPLERRFGLLRLQCYGAGGGGADLVAAGLDRETALRLQERLLRHIRSDDEAEPDAP